MFTRDDLDWVVDFDGTVVNVDLGALFDRWLYQNRKPPLKARVLRFCFAPINVLFRSCDLGQKFRSWSFGQTAEHIEVWINEFLDEFDSRIVINEVLINHLQQRPRQLNMLLTGCPEELVKRFLARREIDVFGEVVGMSMRNSFFIMRHPYGRTKVKLVSAKDNFCAIGDSWPDRHLLTAAEKAIVVGRSNRLNALAQTKNWLVIEPI